MKFKLLVAILLTAHWPCFAQSDNTLSLPQLFELIKKYHPVIKQTELSVDRAKTEITLAQGAFDPIVKNYSSQKTFDNINYYRYGSTEIAIPTWFGIEITGGIETLSGSKTDPTATIGNSNFAGISFPVLKGLVTDKRRAALQQSKIIVSLSKVEQKKILNNILFDAAGDYLEWCAHFSKLKIINKMVDANAERFQLVKKAWENGERPAIDTIEALSQLMSFQNKQEQQRMEYLKAGLSLSAYLWNANLTPYTLPEPIVPFDSLLVNNPRPMEIELNTLLDNIDNHPEIEALNKNRDYLGIDKKLKFQEILPKLDIAYNHLGKGYTITRQGGALLENNYRYGIKFEMPLRLSKGRGEYRSAKLKIKENDLKQIQKKQEIAIKIKQYFTQNEILKKQLQIQTGNYNNYVQLLQAEQTRFVNGESSLFLINSRENKALEEQEKLIETNAKQALTEYALQWSAGLLQ